MTLLFDIMLMFSAILGQTFTDFPFVICAALVLAMRRSMLCAVLVALACGFVTDVVFGREFACCTISFPIAVISGAWLLPEDPVRFFFGDYITPGCTAVFSAGLLQTITPLFYGRAWYHLVQGGCETLLATAVAAGVFPLVVLGCDKIAKRLEIKRIFEQTIKFALRPARR